jgi:hypothetical protein
VPDAAASQMYEEISISQPPKALDDALIFSGALGRGRGDGDYRAPALMLWLAAAAAVVIVATTTTEGSGLPPFQSTAVVAIADRSRDGAVLLYKYGGLYVDDDIEFVESPFAPLQRDNYYISNRRCGNLLSAG